MPLRPKPRVFYRDRYGRNRGPHAVPSSRAFSSRFFDRRQSLKLPKNSCFASEARSGPPWRHYFKLCRECSNGRKEMPLDKDAISLPAAWLERIHGTTSLRHLSRLIIAKEEARNEIFGRENRDSIRSAEFGSTGSAEA